MNDPKTDTDTEAAARWAVARARALGADQAAAEVSADRGLAVAVREGETESVEYTRHDGLRLVPRGGRHAPRRREHVGPVGSRHGAHRARGG